MRKIFNLTQHSATPDQIAEGVFETEEGSFERGCLSRLLTFKAQDLVLGNAQEIISTRADALAVFASAFQEEGGEVMIGGMSALMSPLEDALRARGLVPVYSVTDRVSVDVHVDGKVEKTKVVFKHIGFIPAV